ncbi:MAG TPA: DNA polymerase, partial [Solimonas sp.]|nr:DNA polymerase [Solimonas sp.]
MTAHAAHIDFETQSAVDLKKRALDVYANHPTTQPYCLGFAFDDDPVHLMDSLPTHEGRRLCTSGAAGADRLMRHVAAGELVYAHNAAFELAIWNSICVPRYGWPVLDAGQVRCTMAMCYAMALPGALEHAAAAVGIDMQKDMAGHRIMMQLAKPRPKRRKRGEPAIGVCPHCNGEGWNALLESLCSCTEFHDDVEKYQRVYAYCRMDVAVERALHKRLLELTPAEQHLWTIDRRINSRGVQIDVPAARAALRVIASEMTRFNREMDIVTGGVVPACTNTKALADWVRLQGVPCAGVAKPDVIDLLDGDLPGDVRTPVGLDGEVDIRPGAVRKALLLRQEAGKSSLAKIDRMIEVMGADGRVRNTKQYHSATTGRWGGRHTQFDNLPRPPRWLKKASDQDAVLNALIDGKGADYIAMMYGSPLDALVACVRGFIVAADGCDLIAVDYSNIEGRVLAWLAGEAWKLDAFRAADAGTGPGIYELTYARSFDVAVDTVDEFMRQIGKVVELACGFGGGVGAFQAMAKVYNVKVSDKQADEFKTRWRGIHPNITGYWDALEKAAINAVLFGGVHSAGPDGREVRFKVAGSFLWCRLPS